MDEIEALRCKEWSRDQGEKLRLGYRLVMKKKMRIESILQNGAKGTYEQFI
jgi:hypothetical protein